MVYQMADNLLVASVVSSRYVWCFSFFVLFAYSYSCVVFFLFHLEIKEYFSYIIIEVKFLRNALEYSLCSIQC